METTYHTIQDQPYIPMNILVMEDEANVANGLKMVLTEEGYAVDVARTGHDALGSFNHKAFDLLVADLRLPDINGMDVIKEVKMKWPKTGVVVITGYASVDTAVDAMKLGSFDYLPKPFTEEEIKHTVSHALKGDTATASEDVIRKVEEKEVEKLIQKQEVEKVLSRTLDDDAFWSCLMEGDTTVLNSYRLSWEARAAIASGDLQWIKKHIGNLPEDQLAFIFSRLEREAW